MTEINKYITLDKLTQKLTDATSFGQVAVLNYNNIVITPPEFMNGAEKAITLACDWELSRLRTIRMFHLMMKSALPHHFDLEKLGDQYWSLKHSKDLLDQVAKSRGYTYDGNAYCYRKVNNDE